MILAGIGVLLVGLFLPAVHMPDGQRNILVAKNNLKQLGLALHNYLGKNHAFPARAICNKDDKPRLSWRVAILPYLEADDDSAQKLYEEFRLHESWNSDHNRKLLAKMPAVFRNPDNPEPDRTIYLGVVGEKTLFGGERGAKAPVDVPDGLSNTMMVVEADTSVPWTKPEDLDYDAESPMNGLGHAHPSGFNALLADGSVKFILDSIDRDVLRGLMTANGGEPVTVP